MILIRAQDEAGPGPNSLEVHICRFRPDSPAQPGDDFPICRKYDMLIVGRVVTAQIICYNGRTIEKAPGAGERGGFSEIFQHAPALPGHALLC